MATFGTNSTTVARQRTFTGHQDDEEAAITNGHRDEPSLDRMTLNSEREKRHQDTVQYHSLIPNEEGLSRFWDRFTRKGKKSIGVVQSLRAIAFSSCMFLYSVIGVVRSSIFRVKSICCFHTSGMGSTFHESVALASYPDLYTYVISIKVILIEDLQAST